MIQTKLVPHNGSHRVLQHLPHSIKVIDNQKFSIMISLKLKIVLCSFTTCIPWPRVIDWNRPEASIYPILLNDSLCKLGFKSVNYLPYFENRSFSMYKHGMFTYNITSLKM